MSKKEKPLVYLAAVSKILIKMLSKALEEKGYEVKVFGDGLALVKAIISQHYLIDTKKENIIMTGYQIKSPKKLIEVALPLDDINEAIEEIDS